MKKKPGDLSIEELTEAGGRAANAAARRLVEAGLRVSGLDKAELLQSDAGNKPSSKTNKALKAAS